MGRMKEYFIDLINDLSGERREKAEAEEWVHYLHNFPVTFIDEEGTYTEGTLDLTIHTDIIRQGGIQDTDVSMFVSMKDDTMFLASDTIEQYVNVKQ